MTRDSILALVPALLALVSAIVAAIFAYKAKSRENEAARIRQLEERLSAKKTAMYEPVLQALGNMLTPDAVKANLKGDSKARSSLTVEEAIPRFMIDSVTYASDEVLVAFARFRLASAAVPSPPAQITMRLVADFMIAIRKDIVGPASKATGIELMGVRINDLFSSQENVNALTLTLEELSQELNWRAPWQGRPELGLNPEPRLGTIPSPNRRRR